MLLFPLLYEPLPLPLPVDVVRLLLRPEPPVPFGGAPAEADLGSAAPAALPLAEDAVVDAWLCEPFVIVDPFSSPARNTLETESAPTLKLNDSIQYQNLKSTMRSDTTFNKYKTSKASKHPKPASQTWTSQTLTNATQLRQCLCKTHQNKRRKTKGDCRGNIHKQIEC